MIAILIMFYMILTFAIPIISMATILPSIIIRNASTNNSSGSGGSSSNGNSCIHSNSHSSTSYVDLFNGSTGAA